VEAIAAAARYLWAQDEDPSSFLHRRLRHDRVGLLGHSTGGGGAMWAAHDPAFSRRKKAVAMMVPAGNTEAFDAIARYRDTPVLIFQSGRDTTSFGTGSQPARYFQRAPAVKRFVCIPGANHFGFLDSAVGDEPELTLPRSALHDTTKALLAAFFETYLAFERGQGEFLSGHRPIEGLDTSLFRLRRTFPRDSAPEELCGPG
jgi:pimeloyl-ACP methyl ester carboxylesterase